MWLIEHLPPSLLADGPFGLARWQWVAVPVALMIAWSVGTLFSYATRVVLGAVARRTSFTWDDKILASIDGPLTLAWTVASAWSLLGILALQPATDSVARSVLRTALLLAFFWFLARLVSVAAEMVSTSAWSQARPAARSLVSLGTRIAQVAVLAMAVIAVVAHFGFDVRSLLTGLGIGGLALALAAQKTVENLFGAFSIGVDQPFRVGDTINVEGLVSGNVEVIGLRSTRIRTIDRTLVTMPNGKLADMRIETFASRDRIRLGCILALSRETRAAQMRAVLEGVEGWLKQHPKIWPDGVTAKFKEIGPQSLDIEVNAFFDTTDWNEFVTIRQEAYLEFMSMVERAGTSFAYPTRAVLLQDSRAPREAG